MIVPSFMGAIWHRIGQWFVKSDFRWKMKEHKRSAVKILRSSSTTLANMFAFTIPSGVKWLFHPV